MIDYVRPPLVVEEFLDDGGNVIPYGTRWADNGGDGPDDTYSVTKHPQRFQPLVDLACTIIDHLVATYDVQREDLDEQTVVLRPATPVAAPITFTFSSFPWVNVRAGLSSSIAWFCTCDHCDEDVMVAIERLEQEVAAVVDGGLREWLNDPTHGYVGDDLFAADALRSIDGEVDQSGSTAIYDETRREELRGLYADVPSGWSPWALRNR